MSINNNYTNISAYLKPKAKNLPCLFAKLVEKYSEAGLKSCETNEDNVIASVCLDTDKENIIAPSDHSDVIIELNKTKRLLKLNQLEIQQKSQSIINLNNQIIQMRQQLEGQKIKIKDLKKRLQKAYKNRTKIYNLYDKQCKKNEVFIEQQNLQFANQQERIKTIIEIAKAERESLFDDVKSLIGDNERFSIESLITYTPQE
ncbi:hypothetical protein Glove_20g26 [Diversispora epigaea]|uniref:Uncharacterized protein n=1 Tax=Diversispora epigaea TaxID=1348612 RepID=A0A397JVJ2_9GLOM|nr:hypothetical protein Glove_20g26 [Diversispora epigaea]